MANLRDTRLRMRAINQTLKVTKAMNLISTAKLRKGRRILEDTVPFFNRIQKSMYEILADAGSVNSEFFNQAEETARTAVIVVTSDRGLAGGYNANVFRQVTAFCAELKHPILILIGSVGYRYFIHTDLMVLENFSFKSQLPDTKDAQEITDFIVSQFLWGVFDEVYIVYTHMYSTIKLLPEVKQILPLEPEKMRSSFTDKERVKKGDFHFQYIPSKEEVFDALVPLYVKGLIYGALVEGYVSEQSARMAAMDESSKSAEEMLAGLETYYNRVRQAGITQEVSEIIGGSAALSD